MPTAIWKSRLRSGSAHCDLEVAVEVRQCPLRSGRSGSAHWDLELAVEVRQCPLGSGAHSGGPAVPTGIWTARRRWRRRMRRRRRRRRTALIKSNNPHLAGGEIHIFLPLVWNWIPWTSPTHTHIWRLPTYNHRPSFHSTETPPNRERNIPEKTCVGQELLPRANLMLASGCR